MIELERLDVEVLVDNLADPLSERPDEVTPEMGLILEQGIREVVGDHLCVAQHGLSLLCRATLPGGEERTVLFDGGPDGATLQRNARLLGLDFLDLDALVLSHGHFDHAEGLVRALRLARMEGREEPLPFHAHPGGFRDRAIRLPGDRVLPLGPCPSRRSLDHAGADLRLSKEPEEILGGAFRLSGEIPRDSFERGMANHLARGDDGEWEPDPDIVDERFLACRVKGLGQVVLTGCSHAGVINVLRHAAETDPDVPLHAVMGGLHLVYPNEDLVGPTTEALAELDLDRIIGGHCTGWRALHAFLDAFGEEVVQPLAVASRFTFEG